MRPEGSGRFGLSRNRTNTLDQHLGALLLENDSSAASFHQAPGFQAADPRGHHQDLAFEFRLPGQGQKRTTLLQPQIDVEQHHIHVATLQHRDALFHGGALAHDLEVRLAPQQARDGFAKQRVIVDQQNAGQRSTVPSSSSDSLQKLEVPR